MQKSQLQCLWRIFTHTTTAPSPPALPNFHIALISQRYLLQEHALYKSRKTTDLHLFRTTPKPFSFSPTPSRHSQLMLQSECAVSPFPMSPQNGLPRRVHAASLHYRFGSVELSMNIWGSYDSELLSINFTTTSGSQNSCASPG